MHSSATMARVAVSALLQRIAVCRSAKHCGRRSEGVPCVRSAGLAAE
ncbi:MAG: hypothetical protein IKO55_11615 [Kiritimatiellae bacterium]|nr:hypothetical protein [Kiritimatiellia bacterium]